MNTSKIDLIKAEIKRLKECVGNASSDLYDFTEYMRGELSAYEDVENFINSLPEEPVSKVWHGTNEIPNYVEGDPYANSILAFGKTSLGYGASVCHMTNKNTIYTPITDKEYKWGECPFSMWAYIGDLLYEKEERKKKKQELEALSDEQPSAYERVMESMKQLGKAINSMGVKESYLTNTSYEDCRIQTPPAPIGYLELEGVMTRLPVFKCIGWFHRRMLSWCFGLKFIREEPGCTHD